MVISRVIIRVTPFRALITLLITYLLSPLPLQVGFCTFFRLAEFIQVSQAVGKPGVPGLGFRV